MTEQPPPPKREPIFQPYGLLRVFLWLCLLAFSVVLGSLVFNTVREFLYYVFPRS